MSVEKIVSLDFAVVHLYKHYVITYVKEGVCIDESELNAFKKIADDFYYDRPFVYISNRVEDYNVNPVAYLKITFPEYLLGIAIVISEEKSKNAHFEEKFVKIPYRIFNALDEAKQWAKELNEKAQNY